MRFKNLTEGVTNLKEENVLLRQQKATLQLELNLLKGVDFPTLAGKLEKALQKAGSRKDNIKDLIFKLEVAKRSILDLEEDRQHIVEVKKTLEEKVNNLSDVLEKETTSKQEIETKTKELEDTLVQKESAYQQSLKVKDEEWKSLNQKWEQLNINFEKSNEIIANNKEEIEQLKGQITDRDKSINGLSGEISKKDQEIKDLKEKNDASEATKNKIKDLEREKKQLENEKLSFESEKSLLESEIGLKNSTINLERETVDILRAELKTLENAERDREALLKTEKAKVEVEQEESKKKAKELEQKIDNLQISLKEKEAENENLRLQKNQGKKDAEKTESQLYGRNWQSFVDWMKTNLIDEKDPKLLRKELYNVYPEFAGTDKVYISLNATYFNIKAYIAGTKPSYCEPYDDNKTAEELFPKHRPSENEKVFSVFERILQNYRQATPVGIVKKRDWKGFYQYWIKNVYDSEKEVFNEKYKFAPDKILTTKQKDCWKNINRVLKKLNDGINDYSSKPEFYDDNEKDFYKLLMGSTNKNGNAGFASDFGGGNIWGEPHDKFFSFMSIVLVDWKSSVPLQTQTGQTLTATEEKTLTDINNFMHAIQDVEKGLKLFSVAQNNLNELKADLKLGKDLPNIKSYLEQFIKHAETWHQKYEQLEMDRTKTAIEISKLLSSNQNN